MIRSNKNRPGALGRLPEQAPLANPYVPFQPDNPPLYEAARGLVRGTAYPGLDLPFMGEVNRAEKTDSPLHQLQALGFAMEELALYLDTHREDMAALETYRGYQRQYAEAVAHYTAQHGPLTHRQETGLDSYAWLDDPWPWEYSNQ